MMMIKTMFLVSVLSVTEALVVPTRQQIRLYHGMTLNKAYASLDEAAEPDENDETEPIITTKKNQIVMSKAIPFLECPPALVDCDLAGNVGFDPLGFASNKEQLWNYREAEIKHARLAMLAAVGWPVSELVDRPIANWFGMDSLLDATDRVPSVLNGGLERVAPAWWGFCLGLTAAIDLYGLAKARAGDPLYFPGRLGFDPLNLYPTIDSKKKEVETVEILNGRIAMMAVLGYAVEEYVTKIGVVDETPEFFRMMTLSAWP